MQTLSAQFTEINDYIDKADCYSPRISSASVGWHIGHILLVINAASKSVADAASANNSPRRFNIKKTFVLLTGRIPRKAEKAPKSLNPQQEVLNTDALRNLLAQSNTAVAEFTKLPGDTRFRHTVFGVLTKKEMAGFLRIHTNHHLKIIRDILRQNR